MSFPHTARIRARLVVSLLSTCALSSISASAQEAAADVTRIPDVTVTAPRANFYENPTGQTSTTIPAEATKQTRAFSVTDVLNEAPGIAMKQGNGPRDIGISIRGSNANNGFGVRGAVLFEDGFPVTQPDGLSRTDLTDPHAYGSIDVIRGPSSALFGDYAVGGAINFRTRTGGEIDGYEFGTDIGSFSYLNNYLAMGRKGDNFEAAVFASGIRGDSNTSHSKYDTQTLNALMSWNVTPDDKLTLKIVGNHVNGALSNRLSLNQFNTNPYQRGCTLAATAVAGCQIASFYINGYGGTKQLLSPDEAGLNRDDTRALVGVRWEHKFDENTTWRTQFVADDRNINQPTGTTSAIGDYPSYNLMSDVTSHGKLFGMDATHFFGVFFNSLSDVGNTFNVVGTPGVVVPLGSISTGALTTKAFASQQNMGARVREELSPDNHWTFVAGLGVERSALNGWSKGFSYTASGALAAGSPSFISANQNIWNYAPEFAIKYRPTDEWQFRGRVATAYLTPQISQLFTLSTGFPGNNTSLQSEKDLGFDLGVDWSPNDKLKVSITGFYEFLTNELRSQATPVGAPASSYTFNVPASQHRGVEATLDWKFLPGFTATAAYAYDDQIFTNYKEVLTGAGASSTFNRAGDKLPGVPPHTLYGKVGYEQAAGDFKGLGAFVEYYWQSSAFMDNGNLLSAPGYQLVNANVHWTKDIPNSFIRSVSAFAEVRNIFNTTYVASANNIADTLVAANTQASAAVLANTTGSIYAGIPRTFVAGVKVKF